MVVDHYALGEEWHRALRSHACRVVVIDDLANRKHDCDVLLDQNYFSRRAAARYDGLVPLNCRRLLGPRYSILQPEYGLFRQALPIAKGEARRVLIFFGAGDEAEKLAGYLSLLGVAIKVTSKQAA